MFRSILAFILSGLVLTTGFAHAAAANAQTLRDARAEKARSFVAGRGTGVGARVSVKLRDGRKVKGYVSQSGADSFTVNDKQTNAPVVVSYDQVEKVSKPGGFPTKWVILAGVAVAAIIISTEVLYPVLCDGGAGC